MAQKRIVMKLTLINEETDAVEAEQRTVWNDLSPAHVLFLERHLLGAQLAMNAEAQAGLDAG